MKSDNKIYVSFHIGRGGHFHNPGYLSFYGEEDFQQLMNRCSDQGMIINDDEDGNPLPDSEWKLVDNGDNVILQGRDEIEAMTGRLEWDGIYDTDYVDTFDDLNDDEIDAIWRVYCDEKYMSEELKDAVCSVQGFKRVHSIKKYKDNMDVFVQDGHESFTNLLMKAGEMTRQEWKEELEDMAFCPISVEKILNALESYYTEENDFFKDED